MFRVNYSKEHYVTLFTFDSIQAATNFACALFPSVEGSLFIVDKDGKTLCSFHHKVVEQSQ